jgi:hypothetical protein
MTGDGGDGKLEATVGLVAGLEAVLYRDDFPDKSSAPISSCLMACSSSNTPHCSRLVSSLDWSPISDIATTLLQVVVLDIVVEVLVGRLVVGVGSLGVIVRPDGGRIDDTVAFLILTRGIVGGGGREGL